jgi:hypothetical protein
MDRQGVFMSMSGKEISLVRAYFSDVPAPVRKADAVLDVSGYGKMSSLDKAKPHKDENVEVSDKAKTIYFLKQLIHERFLIQDIEDEKKRFESLKSSLEKGEWHVDEDTLMDKWTEML